MYNKKIFVNLHKICYNYNILLNNCAGHRILKEDKHMKKFKVQNSQAFSNGIGLYSERNDGWYIAKSYKEGNTVVNSYERLETKRKPKKQILFKMGIALIYVLALLVLVLIIYDNDITRCSAMNIIHAIISCIYFIGKKIKESLNEEGKKRRKFRSATNMAVNAIRKFQRIPTMDELKKCSEFSANGDSIELFYILMYLWIGVCFRLIELHLVYAIIALLGIGIISLMHSCGALNFWQYFSTLPPTEEELKVALSAIELWLEHEK